MSNYLVRLGEEAAQSAVAAFGMTMLATDGLGKAAAAAGLVAAGRAVLGILVKRFGQPDSPSITG